MKGCCFYITNSHVLSASQSHHTKSHVLWSQTKNGERRAIPVNDTLRSVFRSLRRLIDVPYVIHDAKKFSTYQNVKRSFATALERARITDFHFFKALEFFKLYYCR